MAGANEALIDTLAKQYGDMNYEQRSGLLIMNSQVLGVLVASVAGGDEKDMQIGASVAGNATQYNRQLHLTERELSQRLAEESDGRFTVEQIEEQMRLSKIAGTEITAGSDMLVDGQGGIYDTGGDWVQLSDGRSLQRISMADKDVDVINYISEQIGIYDWTVPRPIGADAEYFPPFDYKVCVACAAGFSYGLDTTSMRTIEESDAGARSLTLGMASMIALPVGLYALPARSVLTGTVLASGFDAAGQLIGGNEYRPGQTVVAGITGGFTYPLAGVGLLGSMALGGAYGGTNRALNNYIYDEDKNVWRSAGVGFVAGGFGYKTNEFVSKAASKFKYLPKRIGGSTIDLNKPILLQNIGVLNPYPAHIGKAAGQTMESSIPLILDKQE